MTVYAPAVYRALNGVFCIYKPEGSSMKQVINALQVKLTKELNAMPCRPLKQRVILQQENLNTSLPVATTVPDLADHPLVVGPRYEVDDLQIGYVNRLAYDSSGVVVMGIGSGRRLLPKIAAAKLIRVHHCRGHLGRATQSHTGKGRLVEKTTYHHVTHGKIDKVIAGMQAGYQKHMYMASGIDLQTQEAYEAAAKGLIRPDLEKATGPVIYGMKCVEFNPPDFKLEIHSIHEECDELIRLVHELGLELKASAVCSQVRRIRYGHFTLVHALLRKHWDARSILENIDFCRPLVTQEKLLTDRQMQHRDAEDSQKIYLEDGDNQDF